MNDQFTEDDTFDCDFAELFECSLDDEFSDGDEEVAERTIGRWDLVTDFTTSIEIEPIDDYLLELTRKEVPIVLDRIINRMPLPRDRYTRRTPNDFFNVWMQACLLEPMMSWLQLHMGETLTPDELTEFIKVELMLSFFGCTPESFYDSELDGFYRNDRNGVTINMEYARYKAILRALSSNAERAAEPVHNFNLESWREPYSPNKKMARVMETFRTNMATIGFVDGLTVLGLDDDLLRLRSKKVSESGYSQINNPHKGFGVIHHGAVSGGTGLYVAGHVQQRNETTVDCVTIIQKALSGASVEKNILLRGNHCFWDRGYGGPDGVVNRLSIERGCTLSGTSKRVASFPFTFGKQPPGPNRMLIPESGAKSLYWARKKTNVPSCPYMFALGYRNGLGKVVLMHTTRTQNGPGKYAFLTKTGKNESSDGISKNISPLIADWLREFETNNVVRLTETQHTPEWFLLRNFCITGTAAHVIWSALSKERVLEPSVASTLRLLGITHQPVLGEMQPALGSSIQIPARTSTSAATAATNPILNRRHISVSIGSVSNPVSGVSATETATATIESAATIESHTATPIQSNAATGNATTALTAPDLAAKSFSAFPLPGNPRSRGKSKPIANPYTKKGIASNTKKMLSSRKSAPKNATVNEEDQQDALLDSSIVALRSQLQIFHEEENVRDQLSGTSGDKEGKKDDDTIRIRGGGVDDDPVTTRKKLELFPDNISLDFGTIVNAEQDQLLPDYFLGCESFDEHTEKSVNVKTEGKETPTRRKVVSTNPKKFVVKKEQQPTVQRKDNRRSNDPREIIEVFSSSDEDDNVASNVVTPKIKNVSVEKETYCPDTSFIDMDRLSKEAIDALSRRQLKICCWFHCVSSKGTDEELYKRVYKIMEKQPAERLRNKGKAETVAEYVQYCEVDEINDYYSDFDYLTDAQIDAMPTIMLRLLMQHHNLNPSWGWDEGDQAYVKNFFKFKKAKYTIPKEDLRYQTDEQVDAMTNSTVFKRCEYHHIHLMRSVPSLRIQLKELYQEELKYMTEDQNSVVDKLIVGTGEAMAEKKIVPGSTTKSYKSPLETRKALAAKKNVLDRKTKSSKAAVGTEKTLAAKKTTSESTAKSSKLPLETGKALAAKKTVSKSMQSCYDLQQSDFVDTPGKVYYNFDYTEDMVYQMKMPELREKLIAVKLKTSGNKEDLRNRLLQEMRRLGDDIVNEEFYCPQVPVVHENTLETYVTELHAAQKANDSDTMYTATDGAATDGDSESMVTANQEEDSKISSVKWRPTVDINEMTFDTDEYEEVVPHHEYAEVFSHPTVPAVASMESVDATRNTQIFGYSETQVTAMKNAELKTELKKFRLPVSGNKEQLVARLLAEMHQRQSGSMMESPDGVETESYDKDGNLIHYNNERLSQILLLLMNAWFRAPIGTVATKIGNANEKNIRKQLPTFIARRGGAFTINHIQEYGLLANKQNRHLCVSPDGIVVATEKNSGNMFLSLLEMKTKVSPVEEQKERTLLAKYGACLAINLQDNVAYEQFKNVIPDLQHRVQLMHGMAIANIRVALYVVASTTSIIRVVLVRCKEEDLNNYLLGMNSGYRLANLEWIEEGEPPPADLFSTEDFKTGKLKYASDMHTIVKTLDLWRCFRQKVLDGGKPFPAGRLILPTNVAMWNRCKGPIDVYSRMLRNVHAQHNSLSATAFIWLRMIMTVAYNAYQSYAMYLSYAFLLSENCTTYLDYQRFKRRHAKSFKKFFAKLAKEIIVKPPTVIYNRVPVQLDSGISVEVTYRKRQWFQGTNVLIHKRLNKDPDHHLVVIKEATRSRKTADDESEVVDKKRAIQRCCVLCCQKPHKHTTDETDGSAGETKREDDEKEKCQRVGFKTSYECYLCKVPLCGSKRYNNRSCFAIWHSDRDLLNPCVPASMSGLHTRSNRSTAATVTEEGSCTDDEVPSNRNVAHSTNVPNAVPNLTTIVERQTEEDEGDVALQLDLQYPMNYTTPGPTTNSTRGIIRELVPISSMETRYAHRIRSSEEKEKSKPRRSERQASNKKKSSENKE